jgi:hypothetical protein
LCIAWLSSHNQACHDLARFRFICLNYSPGRSTKDKSSTSFPLISTQTKLKENDRCLSSNSSGLASKKKSLSLSGFRIAHWARRIRSVTRDFSKMGSPNSTVQGRASSAPFASLTIRRETTQRQRSLERDSWHSVGHLRTTNVVHGADNRSQHCLTLYRCRRHEAK